MKWYNWVGVLLLLNLFPLVIGLDELADGGNFWREFLGAWAMVGVCVLALGLLAGSILLVGMR